MINTKYLQNLSLKSTVELSNKNYEIDKTLGVEYVKKGIICPPISFKKKYNPESCLIGAGGVVTESGKYVTESAQLAYGMKDRVNGIYKLHNYKIETINEDVIYMNFYIHQWGHFLIDVINRLWFAIKNPHYKIAYTCYMHKNDVLSGNYLELLNLLGINSERLIMVNKITQFNNVIIPESCIYPGKYYTKEYKELFDIIYKNAISFSNKSYCSNLYCSRKYIESNKEIGESQIECVFNNNGYESIYLEKLSLTQSINLLNNADNIVMVNGSLAHNLLFIKNSCNIIIINKTYRMNTHQFLINNICGLDVTYVDAYISPLPVLYGHGPFIMKMTKQFCEFCNDNNLDISDYDIKLSAKEKFDYYVKWFNTYKTYLIRGKKVSEGKNSLSEVKLVDIRNHYKLQIKS